MNQEKINEAFLKAKELFQRHRIIILPAVSGLASLLIIFLVVVPHFLSYLRVREKITQTQKSVLALEAKAEELVSIDAVKARTDLETVYTVLPVVQDVPQAMAVLQDMVQRAGLRLVSTVYTSPGTTSGSGSFGLNISISGPLSQVQVFLAQLQTAPRVFQLQSIAIRLQKGMGEAEVEIPIRVFFSPEQKQIGALNQPLAQLTTEEENLLAKLSAAVGPKGSSPDSTASAVPLGKADPFQ